MHHASDVMTREHHRHAATQARAQLGTPANHNDAAL